MLIKKLLKIDAEQSVLVQTLGTGRMLLAIVNGLHGDEPEGSLLIEKSLPVLERLATSLHCKIALITEANPAAFQTNTRLSPLDGLDLNRQFTLEMEETSNKNSSPSQTLAKILGKYLKQFQIVLDIHSMPNAKLEFIAIFLRADNKTNRNNLAIIQKFSPDYIFEATTEPAKGGSLIEFLVQRGHLGFGLEVPNISDINKKVIDRFQASISNILQTFDESESSPETNVRLISRSSLVAPISGTFFPMIEPSESVKAGQAIGEILTADLHREKLHCTKTGIVLQVKKSQYVLQGSKLLTLLENEN